MARTSLPPGFRFHPTDIELIMYYLKRKVMGKKLHFEAVTEVNIYKFGPWDLPDKSLQRTKDLEWYFFCPREKKHSCGARTKRSTEYGYWKMTGKDRSVIYDERTVGMIKTLIFYKGHAPKGERTNWVIHEYRIMDQNLVDEGITQDTYTLCKVFQKSGVGPKNGAQYGAPFNEEEWSDVEETCADPLPVDGWVLSVQLCPSNMNNSAAVGSTVPGSSCDWPISEPDPSTAGPSAINAPSGMPDFPEEDIDALLSMLTEDCDMLPVESNMVEMPETVRNGNNIQALPIMNGNDIHNGLEDPNWAGLMEAGLNFPTTMNPMPTSFMELKDLDTGYATVLDYGHERPLNLPYTMNSLPPTFMELKDLDTPLIFPGLAYAAEASESDRMRTGSSTDAPEAFCGNLDGSYYGYQGNFQSAVQNVSGLNQHSVMLEGSNWLGENLEGLRKENGTGNFEEHGFNAVPISCVPPGGGIIPDQIQRQGEKLNEKCCSDCGSSIHFKAEVTLKLCKCTKDALLLYMEESSCVLCICWQAQPACGRSGEEENAAMFLIVSFLFCVAFSSNIQILTVAGVLFSADLLMGPFLCDIACFSLLDYNWIVFVLVSRLIYSSTC